MVASTRGDRVGDWDLVRRIGRGGTSTVYSAVHRMIGKRAALKIVRAELAEHDGIVERFVQEARIVNLVAHRDVIDIFHVGWHDDGRVYLVMEFLIGRTLNARCKDGPMSPAEAVSIVLRLCRPLACAHAHGVVHRDLKPDNVFLTDDAEGSRIKLLDWGLSARMDASHACPAEKSLVGTPRYIAPEQARGHHVDERADIYALGAMAYELLLGRAPFEADDWCALVHMHVGQEPAAPHTLWPEIPAELDALLIAMLAKDPDDRPSLGAVQATLLGLTSIDASRAAPTRSLPLHSVAPTALC
jgi:serine/threonine-protein kinase